MKKAVIVLLALVGLLVAIDFASAAVAEYQVSKRLRGHLNLAQDPAVRINGFPFLTQAFAGDYRDVEVAAEGVTVARLSNISVEATLRHVRVPFSDLVSGSADTVRVDEAVGRARIQPAEVGKLINVEDLRVEEVTERDKNAAGQPVPPDAVKLIGTAQVDGQRLNVTVIGSLNLVDGLVQVQPHTVRVDDQVLLPAVEQAVMRLFTVRVDPGQLPFGVTPTSVRADNGALVVEGMARNLVLNTGGSTG